MSVDAGEECEDSPWPKWGLKKRDERGKGRGDHAPNPTQVEVHEWVQPSHCHQHNNTLRPGHLLRWMDITACLSGTYINTYNRPYCLAK